MSRHSASRPPGIADTAPATAGRREHASDQADLAVVEMVVAAGLADIARGDFTLVDGDDDERRLLQRLNERATRRD